MLTETCVYSVIPGHLDGQPVTFLFLVMLHLVDIRHLSARWLGLP